MTDDWRIAANGPIEVEQDEQVRADKAPPDGLPDGYPRDRYTGRPVEQDEL